MERSKFRVAVLLIAAWTGGSVSAQVTQRVSIATDGTEGNFDSFAPSLSSDGRFVAFQSRASNLVPGDTNGRWDVFLRDRRTGNTELVSVDSNGGQGNGHSWSPSISSDGRYVAFASYATNLVTGDTNSMFDVFVRDRQNGTTQRVSVATGGAEGDSASYSPRISADGRFVAFHSYASNFVPGGSNGFIHTYVRDRIAGTTEIVSVDSAGVQGNNESYVDSISADGRFVSFESLATNLVPGDTNADYDVFVRDLRGGTTERVSVDSNGVEGNLESTWSSLSADGRYISFLSLASNLVPGDTNGYQDVFVHDRQSGMTERVSVASGGAQANDGSWFNSSPSTDGRFIMFASYASNLVSGDTNGKDDIFLRDRRGGTTERMSLATDGAQGDNECSDPTMSPDGRYFAFASSADNFVPGDTNGFQDVYVHDREAAGFASVCEPGIGGVITCPCANPPSGTGRGCDNSATTGGASLSASGIAYLSIDSLEFATSGEVPTASSILVQGNAAPSTGLIFGQGARCVGGTLKRLFVKAASGGSITAPDFGGGDPTISARSAVMGDVIQPGQTRWYLVYYRDPIVLGGCPASSTFNATQTGQVTWWP